MKPASHHGGGQVGHVPAPHLARRRGDVGGRWAGGRRRLGAAPVGRLPGVAQKAVEGRFAGQIDPLVSQHRHDARRRQRGKARFVSHFEHLGALLCRQRMCRPWAHRVRPSIPSGEALLGLPALQGAHMNAGGGAGQTQARTGMPSGIDIPGQALAIFEADHSSSSLLKIAATFFESTSSAAVSASALSLRRSSRSSSLIRRLSCLVC